MRRVYRSSSQGLAWPLLIFCAFPILSADTPEQDEFFELKIRPILANRCYACHATTAMGSLSVNSREGLLKGGKSGPAIVPGNPDSSLIIQAVLQTNPAMKMPIGPGKNPRFRNRAS